MLTERGVETEVKKIDHPGDVAGYDAIVLGSAVYVSNWLEPARRFVDEHADELAARPTWLFSSGPIGSPPRPSEDKAVQIEPIVERTRAREHRLSAGKLDKSRLSSSERAVVLAVRAAEGDFRDWHKIAAWATHIAEELNA